MKDSFVHHQTGSSPEGWASRVPDVLGGCVADLANGEAELFVSPQGPNFHLLPKQEGKLVHVLAEQTATHVAQQLLGWAPAVLGHLRWLIDPKAHSVED